MHITEALIEKFFDGRCTPAEGALVSRYLREHPEIWKKYMAGSWGQEAETDGLPEGYSQSMLGEVKRRAFRSLTTEKGPVPFRLAIRRVAAASVILLIAGYSLFLLHGAKDKQAIAYARPSDTGKGNLPAGDIHPEWQLSANRTDQKLKMKLEDGSVVTLLPHSSIRYAKHFAATADHKRDVFLEGQAFFEAARDKGRPFTVYAGDMATTVLGTSFSVHENETGVLIRLYSGKVVVHATEQNLKAWTKDVFLSPGQQLKYETAGAMATVSDFPAEEKGLPKKSAAGPGWEYEDIVFDNTDLPEVMSKLTRHFHMPIEYNKNELSDMYFSGSVLKTDSLSVILKVIANMNGLRITQTSGGFIVHSSKN